MADYLVSRLPAGHAIKDISKPAATNTVRSEQMIIAAPETNVQLLRRQCAAVVWIRSDAYSLENLEKLPSAERVYLLKLFGLATGGTIKAQAKRIDDHVLIYPVAAGPQAPNAGGAGGGAGGGGGGAPPPPLPAAGSLVLALLSQEQATILNRIPRHDMHRLLKEAGVPASDGDTLDNVRNKCAAAAWAAEQLRRPSDVRSLPGSLPTIVSAAFSIPEGWLQEAQDQALSAILEMCRHSSWALDPNSSLGLVSPTRSAIFRAAESVAYPARQSLFAQAGTHLSTQETSKVESLLALSGRSVSDLVSRRENGWPAVPTAAAVDKLRPQFKFPEALLQPRWRSRFAHCTWNRTRFSLQKSGKTRLIEAKRRQAKRDKLLFLVTPKQRLQMAHSTHSQSGPGSSSYRSENQTHIRFPAALCVTRCIGAIDISQML